MLQNRKVELTFLPIDGINTSIQHRKSELKPMRLLDLFCGGGGAGMGYHLAGFEVVGVDVAPQPHYPFDFHQADALEFVAAHGHEFDVIHASPPCQAYTIARNIRTSRKDHAQLVEPTREALVASGKPYVIENVPGAPLRDAIMLCGTMFRLGVFRHRLFECNPVLTFPPMACAHDGSALPIWWKSRQAALTAGKTFAYVTVAGHSFPMSEAKQAMEIDWMTKKEISQAIPPAYTRWIGEQFIHLLRG